MSYILKQTGNFLAAGLFNYDWPSSEHQVLTLTKLGFLKVVFSGERDQFDLPTSLFTFQEKLIQNQYDIQYIHLLSNLFKVG